MEVEDSPNHQIHIEQELLDLIAYCGVSQGCVDALIEHEYTSVAVFRFAFVDTNALETFITHLGTIQEAPPNWSTSREAASIRHLYHQCVLAMNKTPTEKSSSSQNKQAGSMENLLDLAWAELPPARVKEADLLRMKKEFHEKYPSESLSSSNTPCARLVATVVQQQSRGAFVWIPWKELLSESRWLDIQEKGRKRQKLEGIILYDAVGDIDDDELSGAPLLPPKYFGDPRNSHGSHQSLPFEYGQEVYFRIHEVVHCKNLRFRSPTTIHERITVSRQGVLESSLHTHQ